MRYKCDRCGYGPCYHESKAKPMYCTEEESLCDWELDTMPDPRRYEIAKAVMAGMANNANLEQESPFPCVAALFAVKWADALIAELDKEGAK